MATAHNVKDMTPEDEKFRFRLKGIGGHADRIVWGYIPTRQLPVVKLDGEHTYLWVNDPRIDQIILEFLKGGTYAERRDAHEETLFGCHRSSDHEVCLWKGCPLTGGKPGMIPDDVGPCPEDKTSSQESLDLEA